MPPLESVSSEGKQWMKKKLNACTMVEWDRFVEKDHPSDPDASVIDVYGWIPRDDDYMDFLAISFSPAEYYLSYVTSSEKHSAKITEQLTGEPAENHHNECHRAEHHFDLDNAISL
jgi:hypothetical protein